MIIYDKPAGLLMKSEMWRIDARSRSGGETINGREQVVTSLLGRWAASITFSGHSPASIRTIRALVAKMDGRANAVRIGPCDCSNAPPGVPLLHGIPYDDKARHSDGAGFMQGGIGAAVVANAARDAVSVDIFVGSTIVPIPEGVYLGLAGRFYMVVGYTALENETARLDIRPKLRPRPLPADPLVAVPEGEPVLFCGARAPMRFASDDSGSLMLQLARFGEAVFDMVEADF
jgi:hypothetical protein